MEDIQIDDIIDQYKNTVYSVALTHTKNKYDADDVFQEVFLAYWRKSPRLKDDEHRKAWFIKATLNLCKKNHNSSLWKRSVSLGELREEQFVFKEPRENEIFSAIQQMPKKLKTVIYLFYFENMSVKEIAKLLRAREGTVRMQLTRGRDKLRDIMGGSGR